VHGFPCLQEIHAVFPLMFVPLKADKRTRYAMLSPSSALPPCPVGCESCPILAEVARLRQECQRLYQLSQTDPLTGLFNRRHIMTELDREMERTRRTGLPTSLIMVDLDHFKRINDTFGHQFGDAVLRWVCRLLCQNIRRLDIPCRYGGDEFAVVLPGTNLSQALKLAKRLQTCLRGASLEHEGETVSVTASFGVDAYTGREDLVPSAFLNRADLSLMKAKAQGRNQVRHGEGAPPVTITVITREERELMLPALKTYGKKRTSHQATAADLSDQR
jgi:two-component system cell cycle response regulator